MPLLALVTAPRLPALLEPAPDRALEDHERWEELELADVSLASLSVRGAEIVRTRLVDCDLSAAQLQGLRLARDRCGLAGTMAAALGIRVLDQE